MFACGRADPLLLGGRFVPKTSHYNLALASRRLCEAATC